MEFNIISKIKYRFRTLIKRNKFIKIASGVKLGQCITLTETSTFFNPSKGQIEIKKNCSISKNVTIQAYGGKVLIDEHTFLGENVCIYGHGNVEIGKLVLIAANTIIVSSNHTIPSRDQKIALQSDKLMPTKIGNDVWIGANCSILGGITIGEGSVIGAGTVINKNIPPYAIVVGNPARIIRYR